MGDDPKLQLVKLVPEGTVGPGLGFGYAALCISFALNVFGAFGANGTGFTLGIGVVLIGFFVIYLVGGLAFVRAGNVLVGSIYIAFAAAFGLFGGAVDIASVVANAVGLEGVELIGRVGATANILGGAYLLVLLPAMRGFSKVDFFCFLLSGIGVLAFGIAGFAAPELCNMVGAVSLFVAGVLSFYGSVVGCFASVGLRLPVGRAMF